MGCYISPFLGLFLGLPVYDSRESISGVTMKKIILAVIVTSILCLFSGCSAEKMSTEKLRDIEFTVLDEEQIPKELEEMMLETSEAPFKYTYADQGTLYIAIGYGPQSTSGYSIEVKELYETKNAIYIHTNLIGPTKEEKIVETTTYPYIVVKLEYVDKNVVFK